MLNQGPAAGAEEKIPPVNEEENQSEGALAYQPYKPRITPLDVENLQADCLPGFKYPWYAIVLGVGKAACKHLRPKERGVSPSLIHRYKRYAKWNRFFAPRLSPFDRSVTREVLDHLTTLGYLKRSELQWGTWEVADRERWHKLKLACRTTRRFHPIERIPYKKKKRVDLEPPEGEAAPPPPPAPEMPPPPPPPPSETASASASASASTGKDGKKEDSEDRNRKKLPKKRRGRRGSESEDDDDDDEEDDDEECELLSSEISDQESVNPKRGKPRKKSRSSRDATLITCLSCSMKPGSEVPIWKCRIQGKRQDDPPQTRTVTLESLLYMAEPLKTQIMNSLTCHTVTGLARDPETSETSDEDEAEPVPLVRRKDTPLKLGNRQRIPPPIPKQSQQPPPQLLLKKA
ncbi:hypothetical protein Pelo_5428 [Pelomyxa schiedti]|nr:hypothetical protein Pelo_5428 [Pelomyxa schiedti]